jgi:hypothetical protein
MNVAALVLCIGWDVCKGIDVMGAEANQQQHESISEGASKTNEEKKA